MIEVKVPELAESITEGTIANWLKEVGDPVSEGEAVAELETDKVNIEVNAEGDGILQEILKQPGDTVQVGEVIALLNEETNAETTADDRDKTTSRKSEANGRSNQQEQQQAEKETPAQPDHIEPASSPGTDSRVIASPAARKIARERGVDLNKVQSHDPTGRITTDDVKGHLESPAPTPQKPESPERVPPIESTGDPAKPVERQRMSRRRQTIANRLVEVKQTSAMLTTFNEVDMTAIMDLRRRRKESFREQHDVNLGFMSFFTKAVVGALKAFPLLNAEIQGEDMVIKKYYDIGIAVAADEGLVVPVVRDADRLSFAEIEKAIASLAEKARSNTLSLKDLQGGSFTITNGGVFGSLLSTPILNGPQVGILGMHTIQNRPVAVGDEVKIRPMMYIALSYDHRIVDGKEAVSFLVKVKQLLEDPETLLLEG